jgi:hypothetical protein
VSVTIGDQLEVVVAKAILKFNWGGYGLDDVAEADTEWVGPLAADVLDALAKAFRS